MKGLLCNPEKGSGYARRGHRRPPSGSFMGRAVLAGALLASPAASASGQDPGPSSKPEGLCLHQPEAIEMTGTGVVLLDEKGKHLHKGCLSTGEEPLDARLNINDSSAVLLFYPIIDLETDVPVNQVHISYLLDGKLEKKTAFVDPISLGIEGYALPEGKGLASPILISDRIGEGEHTVSFIAAHGLVVIKQPNDMGFMIPSLVEIPGTPETAPVKVPERGSPEDRQSKPGGPEPDKGTTGPAKSHGKTGTFGFARSSASALRDDNKGEMNWLELRYYPRLTDNVSILAGISADYLTMGIDGIAHVGLLSASLQAGLGLHLGGHTMMAGAYGGIRNADTSIVFDGRRIQESFLGAEYGGLVSYAYGDIFGIELRGGNNPINPATLRIYSDIPYSWADIDPRIEFDIRWLHLLRPLDDGSGAVALDSRKLRNEGLLRVPIYTFGPLTPSLIAGFSSIADTREFHPLPEDMYLGTTMTMRVFDRMSLEIGGAYAFNNSYLAVLRMGVSGR